MPFLIPMIPALAALTGAALAAATIALTVVEMVAMYLVSKLLTPKQGGQLSNGATEEYSGTVEPRRIVYGEQLIGGLNAIPPWCHGPNNAMLDQVLVLAGHQCNAITDCFINQEEVLSANIAPITGGVWDGVVNAGTFTNKIWLRRHTGAPSETVDYILNTAWPTSWTPSHLGVGIAKVYVQFQYDTTTYSGGRPQLRFKTQGKIIYDPRLDTAPGAHVGNPTYMVYSPNPALCAVDYILDPVLGIGEDPKRIDWVAAVAAANVCDEFVAVPLLIDTVPTWAAAQWYAVGDMVQLGGVVYACLVTSYNRSPPSLLWWSPMAAGTAVQRRYTCNTVLDCTQPYEDNLKAIASAFQGAVLYTGGKWVLLPGMWVTPTFAIGDDDIAGQITYNTAIPYTNRYNAVRGQFYDPANLYQPTEYPGIRVAADELADGEGPVWQELQQPSCVDVFEAQRNAMILQRKSRRKKTWSFPASYASYGIRPGEFGTLTLTELSIFGQYVRCTGWRMDGKAMTMQIDLEEVSPTDWYDPALAVYQTEADLVSPAPANFVSDPVSALTAFGGAGGITFNWVMPAIWHSNLSIELLESLTDDMAFATMIWSGVNTGTYIQRGDTGIRFYWVRVRNFAGQTTSVTDPLSPTAGLAASATSAAGPPGPIGLTGPPALVGSLTLEAIVLPADASGHVTSYLGANGQFVVFLGSVDVTAACTFSIAPLGNLSNLNYTLTGEAAFGLAVTGQTEGAVAIGSGSNSAIGTVTVSESQSSIAAGYGARSQRFDASSLHFDTNLTTWDLGVGVSGGGGPGPPPVTGTGATTE